MENASNRSKKDSLGATNDNFVARWENVLFFPRFQKTPMGTRKPVLGSAELSWKPASHGSQPIGKHLDLADQ